MLGFLRPAAYDAYYLALAEMMNCEFWTADKRLFNAVKDELPWVHWLGKVRGWAKVTQRDYILDKSVVRRIVSVEEKPSPPRSGGGLLFGER